MNKYADKPQGLSHTLDGVWQSIQNSGKSGVREWVEKIRNAANVARNLEKRNRELEAALEPFKAWAITANRISPPHYTDGSPVFGFDNGVITLGDLRRVIEATKEPQS